MNFDLHTHTNFSACANKENSWESLLTKAQEKGIELLSVTDHDTCLFHVINHFTNTKRFFQGKIIPGMECDVVEDGVTFELLAYNFDVMKVFNWAYKVYGTLEIRQTRIKDALVELVKQKSFAFDDKKPFNGKVDYAHKYVYEDMLTHTENNDFFDKYQIKTLSDFYRLSTTDKDFPLYMNMDQFWPSVDEVAKAIHEAGGIVVLAHPYNYKSNIDTNKLLQIVLEKDIDGVEVYHPSCDLEKINFLIKFAKKHNLIITGGSDYHGTEKHNTIGIDNCNKIEINLN